MWSWLIHFCSSSPDQLQPPPPSAAPPSLPEPNKCGRSEGAHQRPAPRFLTPTVHVLHFKAAQPVDEERALGGRGYWPCAQEGFVPSPVIFAQRTEEWDMPAVIQAQRKPWKDWDARAHGSLFQLGEVWSRTMKSRSQDLSLSDSRELDRSYDPLTGGFWSPVGLRVGLGLISQTGARPQLWSVCWVWGFKVCYMMVTSGGQWLLILIWPPRDLKQSLGARV